MTTFAARIYRGLLRRDGTYNVKIRVTHNRRSTKVSTPIFIDKKDVTGTMRIKDQAAIDEADKIVRKWRKKLNSWGLQTRTMSVEEIVSKLQTDDADNFKLDFLQYGRSKAKQMSNGTAHNYLTALNAFERFVGKAIDINSINGKLIAEFIQFIHNEPVLKSSRNAKVQSTEKSKAGGRAETLYPACLRALHNMARREFNDEDRGIIRIPGNPFAKCKISQPIIKRRNALDKKELQKIISFTPSGERETLARDCFLMSFALAGMNAADLLNCPAQDTSKGIIEYNRTKTASRRADRALMRIRIEPCIAPLVKKYLASGSKFLFIFKEKYKTINLFDGALRAGIQRLIKDLNLPGDMTFYTARHTWATLAHTSKKNGGAQIEKSTIAEALNHVSNYRTTDLYIDKDWNLIWEANKKVLKILDWNI
jgi:integrase